MEVAEADHDRNLNAIIKVVAYGRGGKVITSLGVRAHWDGRLPTTFHGEHGKAWTWSNPAARDARLNTRPDGTGGISIEAWATQLGANSVDVFAQAAAAVTLRKDAHKDNHAPGHALDAKDAGDGSSTDTGHANARGGAHDAAEENGSRPAADARSPARAPGSRASASGEGEHATKGEDRGGATSEAADLDESSPDPEEEQLLDQIELELARSRGGTGDADASGGHGKAGGDSTGRTGPDTTIGGAGPGGEHAKADGDGAGSVDGRDGNGTAAGDALGTKHGSDNGLFGGEGREGDDGVRGAGAAFGGLIAVPAALKGLVEIGLLIDAGDITGAAGDLLKKGAGKAISIATARRALAHEARVFARQEVKAIAKHMAADKAFRALAKEERAQLMRIWLWETQRKYFRAYLKTAKAEQRLVRNALRRAKPGELAALTVRDAAAQAGQEVAHIEPVAGRLPVNHEYAGKEFPRDLLPPRFRSTGLRFKSTGYPDFEPFAMTLPNGKKTVSIELTGIRRADDAAANAAARLEKKPVRWTWHHVEGENGTMMLVPDDLHDAVRHSGGTSNYKHRTGTDYAR